MYDLEFTHLAQRNLSKLEKSHQEIILKKLNSIRENPFSHLKKLKGDNFWRLRVMKYRIVLDVIVRDNKIFVLRIGHRKNVYD